MPLAVKNKVDILDGMVKAIQGDEEHRKNALHQAARAGNTDELLDILRKIRDQEKEVNELDDTGTAPLHYATRYDQKECVKILLQHRADPLVQDKELATPLHYVARKKESGDPKVVKDIIDFLLGGSTSEFPRCKFSKVKTHKYHVKDVLDGAPTKSHPINARDKYGCTSLHFACMRGNMSVVRALLTYDKININEKDHLGVTPLQQAVGYNHPNIVELLVSRQDCEIDAQDDDMVTGLHLVAMEGDLRITKMLVEGLQRNKTYDVASVKEFVELEDSDCNTALHLAIENRNFEVAEYLIERMSPELLNSKCRPETLGCTCLHLAAISGDERCAQLLFSKESFTNVDVVDMQGKTALHRAAEYGNCQVMEFLLNKGANVNAVSYEYLETPLICCSYYTDEEPVKLLLKHGADVTLSDKEESTAIMIAATNNCPGVLTVLLQHLADNGLQEYIDEPEIYGNSPLHSAAAKGNVEIIKILHKFGASLNAKNEDEETPFHLAAENGNSGVCEYLLKELDGRCLNDEDEECNTALHKAAECGKLNTVQKLIDAGADKEARNLKNWTPLDFAASKGWDKIVKYLLEEEDVHPDPVDTNDMQTPLHLASRSGHVEVVKKLIENDADVTKRDHKGYNALDLAIRGHHEDVALAILDSPMWKEALMNDSTQNVKFTENNHVITNQNTPFRKMICTMPDVGAHVLDKCITTGPEGASPEAEGFYVDINFEILDDAFSVWSHKDGAENVKYQETIFTEKGLVAKDKFPYTTETSRLKENHTVMLMGKYKRDELMGHPVTRALLRYKWGRSAIFFYTFLIFYATFLIVLSAYSLIATPPYQVNSTDCSILDISYKSKYEGVAEVLLYIFCSLGIILEISQLYAVRRKYLDLTNFLDWFTYLSTILIIIDLRSECSLKTDWQWQLSAFNVFFAWINLLLFFRRLPRFGIYVVMIVEILKTFLRFFFVFFFFILAFAISFTILLKNQDPFSHLGFSIMKTWVMMLGEMDYGDIFFPGAPPYVSYPTTTYFLFGAFLIVMAIIIMNLLTGLAVDDVNVLQAQAQIKKQTMQIEMALDVEVAMPFWLQRKAGFVKNYLRVYPNQKRNLFMVFLQWLVEGSYLSEGDMADHVMSLILNKDESEPDKVFKERLFHKLKKQKTEIRDLRKQLTNIEELLMERNNKKMKRRETKRGSKAFAGIHEADEAAD